MTSRYGGYAILSFAIAVLWLSPLLASCGLAALGHAELHTVEHVGVGLVLTHLVLDTAAEKLASVTTPSPGRTLITIVLLALPVDVQVPRKYRR